MQGGTLYLFLYLAHGYFSIQTGEARVDVPIGSRPGLPPEPQDVSWVYMYFCVNMKLESSNVLAVVVKR